MTVVNINDVKLSDEERQPCEVWTRVKIGRASCRERV